ncbi:DUF4345 family protein [Maricaulis sp. D1M11]|uniref:DUF4345 family protein n=1 Tax=Maricaulis sp. D1M11 TaxID=3076117 RepID=UPI0039B42DE8
MPSSPIFVTGATGKTGSRITSRLKARGYDVREGSRSGVIPFDWDQPATWPAALARVSAVYICFQPDYAFPGALDTLAAFAQALAGAGIDRIVMLTGRGEPAALKAEAIMRRICPSATILRSAWFAQNFSEGSLRDAVMSGMVPMPGGDIREPVIDVEDLADVAVAALIEDHHASQIYELTGPRLLGFDEIAAILGDAIGHPVRHVAITFEAFHAELERAAGRTFADIVTEIARETFDGRNAHVTGGVERALGRPPCDFTDFAKREAEAGAWRETQADPAPDPAASPTPTSHLMTEKDTTMTPSLYQKVILGLGGVTALVIGAAITLFPAEFYASYGITLDAEPNLMSELRAPGANLAALGGLMLGGVARARWFAAARMIALTVFFAFAAGRLVSWVLDGMPDSNVLIALGIELAIGVMVMAAAGRGRHRPVQ